MNSEIFVFGPPHPTIDYHYPEKDVLSNSWNIYIFIIKYSIFFCNLLTTILLLMAHKNVKTNKVYVYICIYLREDIGPLPLLK